ncbi:hypothetical protein ES705_14128 [subsurface metagenome]
MLLSKIENFKESIKCFDEALRIDPNNIPALNNKAISYLKSGLYDEAYTLFKKVYQLDQDDGNFNYNQACIAALKNETYKALKLLNIAVDYDEKYIEIAKDDQDFKNIKDLDDFKNLINK